MGLLGWDERGSTFQTMFGPSQSTVIIRIPPLRDIPLAFCMPDRPLEVHGTVLEERGSRAHHHAFWKCRN